MENLDSFLLGVFCFFMGAAVVGIVLYLRGMGKPSSGSDTPPDPDLVEVARLWRSRKTNRMVVGLDGKNLPSAADLSSSQHQRLTSAAGVLQTWLGQSARPVEPAPLPSPPTAFAPSADQPSQPPPPVHPISAPPVSLELSPNEVKPVAPRPLDVFGRVLSPSTGQSVPLFKSIPEQINEVLQSRIPGSPFEDLGLVLKDVPGQGVVVQVGTEQYPGVDAVPDTAVREFVKQAVAEWEAKTRGGIS